MGYSRAWNEATPTGSDLANQLDTIIQNTKIDFRERIAGIFGLTALEFAADPIVPKTLTLSGALVAASFNGPLIGNASTATSAAALTTPRAINGVAFDGTAPITITAAAGTLTGAALAAGVTGSSLTSVGILGALSIAGALTFTAAASKIIPGATSFSHRNNADSADNLFISDAGDVTARANLIATGNLTLNGNRVISINGNNVVGSRVAGWATQTGASTRADMGGAPSAATVASTLNALVNDMRSHGLI